MARNREMSPLPVTASSYLYHTFFKNQNNNQIIHVTIQVYEMFLWPIPVKFLYFYLESAGKESFRLQNYLADSS